VSARPSVAAIRRLQIIEATRRVILRKGYHRVTTQDIAREAGVSVGIPHHYFASLDAILSATLEHVAEEMRQFVVDEIARAPTPRAKLEAYVLGESPRHRPIREGWLVWLEYWADAIRDPRLADFHRRRYDWWRERLAAIIAEGIADGSFRAIDVDDAVGHLIGLVDGLSIQASVHDARVGPADFERIVLEHIRSQLYVPSAVDRAGEPLARAV
jgi:AcrR family transcriptional regulator